MIVHDDNAKRSQWYDDDDDNNRNMKARFLFVTLDILKDVCHLSGYWW